MNKIIILIVSGLLLSACNIKEPRLTFGKKCVIKDNKVVYSYVWVYDKQVGVPADKETCKLLKN
tara:strand:- start:6627 stop:6818 length:192 start_codon:yes stop_codon:yes gene_type:complete